MTPTLISEADFDAVWGAMTAPNGELWSIDETRRFPPNCVWTVFENGAIDDHGNTDNNWYATPGVIPSTSLGYIVTQKPWNASTQDAVWYTDDDAFARDERRAARLDSEPLRADSDH